MKVIVCGGRRYGDFARVCEELSRHAIAALAHGGAPGADLCARQYAIDHRIPHRTFPANWQAHGKAAGPIRNQQMLDEFQPDAVIAFPGGKGTADMVRRARAAGVRVIEVEP